jgi:ABC-type multidrug transport system ATPase subunit
VVSHPNEIREMIALTGQFAAIDELLTGRENLRMFGQLFRLDRREATRRADELLERFDLANAGDRLARTYSGGMRRRLDLASSLLTRPRILFLDEPTTGLDPRSRNQIWDITRELVREGTTVLLTTQYLEEADQLTDRIAVIDHGRVIAEGTGDELKDSVGGQMIFVRLANPWDRERAIEALTRLGCGTPEPSELERELTLPAPEDGIAMIERSAHSLREAGIAVSDLGLRRPTLDDVFLTLTGAPASADGAGPETGELAEVEPEAAEAPSR